MAAHGDQVRKGTTIPYISHLLQVAGLVLELGGDEDEAIGGLLHDSAEDGGGESVLTAIRDQFGEKVEQIVRENSDSITESKDVKAPWRERKEKYIAGIATKSASALLVSICDKIHNARSLNADSWFLGEAHWDRFNASKEDSIWYYQSLIKAFQLRESDDSRLTSALASLKLEVESFTSK
ncbi:MAG: HD domain-containing protein [Chthonomonas sp.]|nr:HD domain-containing protein [Chthonomonas sp.]